MRSTDKLEADAATLHELLNSEKEFLAPIFQRRFVWKDEEFNRLWDDIDQVADQEDTARFLGAIVLQDHSSRLAFAPRVYWIIDGQQRLMTLFLLLTAIAELTEEHGPPNLAQEVVPAYLLNRQGDYVNKPKLRPTNRDLRQFSTVLQRLKKFPVNAPPSFGDAEGDLLNMYFRMRRELQSRFKQQDPSYPKRLATIVLENLKFVQIVLSEDEDPHQVFDSLNNAGQKLEIIDLVRNTVFERFDGNLAAAETLYNTRWRSFEDSLGSKLNSYFFPFTLVHRSQTTKSKVFAELKNLWESHSPEKILDSLSEYVPAYKALTAGEALEVSTELKVSIDRLRRMPAPAVVYPYAMRVIREAVAGSLDHSVAAHDLALVEAFLVRRAFAGFEPTGLHAVFKTMWKDTGGDPFKLISVIDENPTIQFPSDSEFTRLIRESNLYNRRLANYVVVEYERGLKGGDPLPDGAPITLDHVMPQELSDEWRQIISTEAHDRLEHTWANLVPMSRPFNAQKGQKSWSEVRSLLRTETIYKTPRRLAEEVEIWNEQAISDRADQLADWAVKRWPKK